MKGRRGVAKTNVSIFLDIVCMCVIHGKQPTMAALMELYLFIPLLSDFDHSSRPQWCQTVQLDLLRSSETRG